jgi:hypothetical protein
VLKLKYFKNGSKSLCINIFSENDPVARSRSQSPSAGFIQKPVESEQSTATQQPTQKQSDDDIFKLPLPVSCSPVPRPSCSSSLTSSIDDNLDKLTHSQKANTFNAEAVPDSFSTFMLDLRKSVHSSTKNLNDHSPFESLNTGLADTNKSHYNSSSNTTSAAVTSKTSAAKFLTSSVDKDLDNSDGFAAITGRAALAKSKLMKSLDFVEAGCASPADDGVLAMTSSPFKRPAIPVLSSSTSVLNRTIDIDSKAAAGSVESLCTTHSKTTCSSAGSFSNMKNGFGGSGSSVDRPVLNTTYNAWNGEDEEGGEENGDVNMVEYDESQRFNKTQDFNNNDENTEVINNKKKRISGKVWRVEVFLKTLFNDSEAEIESNRNSHHIVN